MTFSKWNYVIFGAIIPCVIGFIGLVHAFDFYAKLVDKKKRKIVAFMPVLLWTVFILAWLCVQFVTEGCKYPLTLAVEFNAPIHTTIGEVTDVYKAPSQPKYYNKITGVFESADFIEVDGRDYYMLSADVKEGDIVKLEWLTIENIVLSYEVITAEEYDASEIPPYPSTEDEFRAPPIYITLKAMHIGAKIIRACIVLLLLIIVCVQYLFDRKITKFLENKDREVYGIVKANGFGVVLYSAFAACFVGAMVGGSMVGSVGLLPAALLIAIVFAGYILNKQTTKIELRGDVLYYKTLFTKKQFRVTEISQIEWVTFKRKRKSMSKNRALQITFRANWTIYLEQEWYWGLENMYNDIVVARSNINL